jgi:hypothetical protein
MTSQVKQFLELFHPLPGNHYIQVTTNVDETTTALYELLNAKEGEFRLALYQEEEPTQIQEAFPLAKIQHINNFKTPFRALPRDNDTVIFKDIFHQHEAKERLLKITYTTLANTANVLIMEKKGVMDIPQMLEMLQEYEFRSPNYIDILPDYDLVIAKKMHMWGNGL